MTMMIQAIRLTRKKAALAVILAGAVLAALILLLGQHGGNVGASEQPCLSSNGERVAPPAAGRTGPRRPDPAESTGGTCGAAP